MWTLSSCYVRLIAVDLLRCNLGMLPHGLVCTTYVGLVLCMDDWHLFETPAKLVVNAVMHYDGRLYIRDVNGNLVEALAVE